MKKNNCTSLAFITGLLLLTLLFPNVQIVKAEIGDTFPFAVVNKTGMAPTIDGKGDDICWKKSVELTGFSIPRKLNYALEQTSLRLLWDKENLYGLIICDQLDADMLPPGTRTRDDHQIWRNNSVEIFLVTSPQTIRQIIINSEGTVGDQTRGASGDNDWQWNSDATTAAFKENNRWIVEFSIPLSKLDIKTDCFRFNVVRNNTTSEEYSSWSPIPILNWWQPDLFGALKFEQNGPGIELEGVPELKPHAEFALKFIAETTSNVNCDIVFVYQNRKIRRKAALPPDSTVRETFKYAVTTRKPGHRNVIELRIDSDRPLYRFRYSPANEYLAVYSNNTPDGIIYLSRMVPAKISWNSVHTFPGGHPGLGGKLKKTYDIVFDCPDGVSPKGGRKIGPSPHGPARQLWACRQNYAYYHPNWLATELINTLPEKCGGEIYYYAQWDNQRQPEEKLTFQVIELKPVKPPKRFVTQIYNFWPRSVKQAEEYRRFGINTIHHRSYNATLVKDLLEAGFYVVSGGYFFPGDPKGYLEWPNLDRSARAKDLYGYYVTGKKGFQLSPAYRGKYYQQAIEKEIAFAKASGINYYAFDMEGYIMPNARQAGFNEDSLQRFKDYFAKNFPEKNYLDPRDFEKEPEQYPEHHKIWIDFKSHLFADMFLEFKRRLADAVGQSCPYKGVIISEWSFLVPDNDTVIEESMRGPEFMEAFDFFELSAYSGVDRMTREILDRQRRIEKSFPKSKTRFLACPSPVRLDLNRQNKKNYYYSPAPVLPEELKYKIMEAAATGMKGVSGWYLPAFTLQSWKYWNEGIAIVNEIEDIVLDGESIRGLSCEQSLGTLDRVEFYNRKVTLRNQPKILVKGMHRGDRGIIAVSEYNDLCPVTVTVTCQPQKRSIVTDVETNVKIAEISPSSPNFKVKLDQARCRMLLYEPHGTAKTPTAQTAK